VTVSPAGSLPTGESGGYRFGGGPNWGLAYGTKTLDCAKGSKVAAPVGRWVCIEWKIDGNRDEQRYWVDGQPLDDLTVIGKAYCFKPNKTVEWQAPVFSSISLGWEHYLSAPAAEGWLDDVVIDNKPIGCPQPSPTTH
jgi:hypothetical protein